MSAPEKAGQPSNTGSSTAAVASNGTSDAGHERSLETLPDGSPRFRGCSPIAKYDVLGKLGEGTFGEVHRARDRRDGSMVALKKILLHHEKDGFPITALREIKLLKMLSHENVLQLKEMAVEYAKKAGKTKSVMYMVTPYMDHDLSGLLENPRVQISEAQIKCYMLQLLKGVQYLHAKKILHRDMKAANLLINNKGILQIGDFGLARPYDEDPPQPGNGGGEAIRDYTQLVVTRWYRPPELFLGLKRYTSAIDMWGVGCVFGEMFKKKPMLAGSSELKQLQMIFELVGSPTEENMPGWSSLPGCEGVKSFAHSKGNIDTAFGHYSHSPEFLDLLKKFLRLDWRKRINAIDALEHPYFKANPPPALPGDIPQFEESHELDRRRFRESAAMPPAPAGGTVGMGHPTGDWGNPQHGGRRPPGPPPPSNGRYGGHRGPQGSGPPHNQDRRPRGWGGSAPNTSLPAKPPPSHDAGNWAVGSGWAEQNVSIARQPRGRGPPNAPPPNSGGNVDTYIPSYNGAERPRGYEGRRPGGGTGLDYGDTGDNRDRDRERDRDRDREWDRRRSRSPGRRHGGDRPRDRGGAYARR